MTRNAASTSVRRWRGCASPHKHARVRTLRAIVMDYIRRYRNKAREELDWFRGQPSLARTMKCAGLAADRHGRKFRHQYRIRLRVLHKAAKALATRTAAIRACPDFDALFGTVEETIYSIRGIGDVTVYDTALRIGAKLKHEPSLVYLHAGTRDGARALGLDGGRRTLSLAEVPKAFRILKPREIEDCLCIYKADLARIARARRTGR